VVTWGSGSSLTGDLTHPPASAGWTAQPGSAFAVINTAINTLTYTTQGSAWFNSASGPDNINTQGRGSATLIWPQVSGAAGYHIYLNDGSGNYRQVGATQGGGAIMWSSAGGAFYPGDSEIAGFSSAPANAYYRATTPTDGYSALSGDSTPSSLQASVTPSPAPSPTASPGSGVVVADASNGQYVYEHNWGGYGGPTVWTKIGTGNGTTLGHNYGTVGPDISTIGGNSTSAFYLSGYLYDGATTAASANSATVVGVNTTTGATQNLTFSGGSPLNPANGSAITANANNLLLASATDAEGVTHIYSAAYTLSTNAKDGSPRYDGYRFLDYSATGAKLGDHTIGMTTGSSEYTDGLLADGSFLYLVAWSSSSSAHITKVSTTTWQIVNQYPINQGTTQAINGCYDPINNCFWLGALSLNCLYRYAGSGGTANPNFAANPGFDPRDNPNPLYKVTANGSQYGRWTAYDFKVVPFTNASGVSSEFAPTTAAAYEVAATLDNRSYTNNPDPQHTTTDLGSWDNHDVQARLDLGVLQVDTSDLAIATWGPGAALSRTYLSSGTTGRRFAPGWVLSFDAHLDLTNVGSGAIDYYDTSGDKHHFVLAGSWQAPQGFLGTLAPSGSNWTITYPDGTVDAFTTSGSSALWSSEADRNGNTTTYAWNAGNLTITAANGQQITVTCNSSGQVTKATYVTTAGTREIDYQTASPWQVTYYTGSAVQRYVTYGYTSGRLSAINQLNWPASGQTASEAFVYGANGLSEVDYPDYNATSKPDARATIAYVTGSATITRYGTVAGTANQPSQIETDSWSSQTGTQTTQVETSANSTESSTTQFAYATNEQQADALTVATNSANETTQNISACNSSGDTTAESDGGVGITTDAYTDSANPNLPTVVTDPNQDVTNNTYDSHGNLTATQQTLNSSGDVSATQYSYDSCGRTTEQKQLISGTPSSGSWATSDYSAFALNGEPQTTINRSVQLTYGGATQDLTTYATYDPFGNLLTQTDTSGSRVTQTNTYDLAAERLTSLDAYGITANSSYDCLGNVTTSWQSAASSSQKDHWQSFTCDPMGRVLIQTTKLSDSSGNLTTQDVTTNTWDGVGNELASTSSTLGGQAAKCTYDDQGNTTAQWRDGVYDYTTGRGTQDSYDSQNQVLSETVPGNSNATTYVYNPDGSTAQQNNPDGSFVAYGYDADGNKVSQTVPLSGYSSNNSLVATTNYAYDSGNRLTSVTEPNTLKTTYTYDELGRQISAQGSSDPATNTTYNTLGWVLRKVDGDGVTDSRTYDTHGCVVGETIGSKTTTSTYDADNRLKTQTDADSNKLTNTYDAFGNVTEAKHQNSGGTVLKDVSTTVDSLGRPTLQTDTVTGLSHTWTYPVNTASGIQETVK
jgi:YD repeat-containing protein